MTVASPPTRPVTGRFQQARDLAMNLGDRFVDFRDHGSNFTRSFDAVFQAAGRAARRRFVRL